MDKSAGLSPGSRVTATEDALTAELGEEAVILHLGRGRYYGLDPVGARVWQLLQRGPSEVSEIMESIATEYDVKREECRAEILRLLSEMASHHLIRAG